jgi:hypothetical protein
MLFSQRKGITAIKTAIQVESVDVDLRNALWTAVTRWRRKHDSSSRMIHFDDLMRAFWLSYYKQPLDTLPGPDAVLGQLRNKFLNEDWYYCYDILEFLVTNYPDIDWKVELIQECNQSLERELSAYRFVGNQMTQITSETEIQAIEQALASSSDLKPVQQHLATALEYLSDRKTPDYRNSIKESISAVESLCNLITGDKASLGEALKQLEKRIPIHPALKKAFSSIYGYTSDAHGIRHALLDEANLDFEDAKFMLVSCSGFVNYLIAKRAKAETVSIGESEVGSAVASAQPVSR